MHVDHVQRAAEMALEFGPDVAQQNGILCCHIITPMANFNMSFVVHECNDRSAVSKVNASLSHRLRLQRVNRDIVERTKLDSVVITLRFHRRINRDNRVRCAY